MKKDLSQTIKEAYGFLLHKGKIVNPNKWQSVTFCVETLEYCNLYLDSEIPKTEKELATLSSPDLPWSEDHFQERIFGEPLNPGDQYKNWPWYSHLRDNKRFRNNEGGKFSHTYMERFWPPKELKGIRFNYGNLNDVIEKLREDRFSRQAYLSIWYPEDQSNNSVRVPCTLGYYFILRDNKLSLTYHIRSCDAVRHFRNDIYMACRLAQHVALILKVEVGGFYMWIGSFHCFQAEAKILKRILKGDKNGEEKI